MSSSLSSYYQQAPLHVWVEDADTRIWLEALWQGQQPYIQMHVAGGRDHVKALCNAARQDEHHHVFGLIDKDFGSSNLSQWTDGPSDGVYRLPVHEVENYFLDPEALSSCKLVQGRKTTEEIQDKLLSLLKQHIAYVALVRVFNLLNHELLKDFPSDRSLVQKVKSRQDARSVLTELSWLSSDARLNRENVSSLDRLHKSLDEQYRVTEEWVDTENWKVELPGKEIFRALAAFVVPGPPKLPRADLIKSIADFQTERGSVPADIQRLRDSLKSRLKRRDGIRA